MGGGRGSEESLESRREVQFCECEGVGDEGEERRERKNYSLVLCTEGRVRGEGEESRREVWVSVSVRREWGMRERREKERLSLIQ